MKNSGIPRIMEPLKSSTSCGEVFSVRTLNEHGQHYYPQYLSSYQRRPYAIPSEKQLATGEVACLESDLYCESEKEEKVGTIESDTVFSNARGSGAF